MFIHSINPTLLKIGFLEIRYYGVIYALGFIIAYFMIRNLVSRKKIDLDKDEIMDLIFYLIVGTVSGARLFFVFYNIPYFIRNPLKILAVWEGGLIFLGGFLGAIVALYIYCKKKKMDFFRMMDICVVPLPLALALGRIANFINSEFVGRLASVPWAVKFPSHAGFRHPVQLYNSIALFMIFLFLLSLTKRKSKTGTMLLVFLLLYSLSRFLLGFFKIADQYGFILGLTIEQIVYLLIFVSALIFFIKSNRKDYK